MLRLVLLLAAVPLLAEEAIVVVHKRADSVGIYSTRKGETLATVPVGVKPHELVLSKDGRYAYVTNYGVDSYRDMVPGENTVSVIDLQARKKAADISTGKYRRPHGIELGASGRLYVTTDFPAAVLVIDPAERKVVRAFELEDTLPHMLAVTANERKAYVACSGSATVAVLDLESGQSKPVEIGGTPMGILLSRDEKRVYATNRNGNAVAVIDTSTDRVVTKLSVQGEPVRLRLTPDARWMIVTDIATGQAWIVDMLTFQPKYKIPVGLHAEGISIDAKGRHAYLSSQGENKVVKVRLDVWQPVLEIKTGERPDSSAVFDLK